MESLADPSKWGAWMSETMLKGMITENELIKLMEVKPSELRYLRVEKGMPFVQLSKTMRVYLEEDLMEWFKKNRTASKASCLLHPTASYCR